MLVLAHPQTGDVPFAAYTKATRALDEFDSRALEYSALLDTQRALLRSACYDAVASIVERGDVIARAAAACGARVAALRAEMDRGSFSGPRASELRRRFADARRRSETLQSLVEGLAVAFARARDDASRILAADRSTQTGASGYAVVSRNLALDTTV